MVFFDLNVPYIVKHGGAAAAAASQEASVAATRAVRVRTVVRAMELGYSGVAYNQIVKGVISDAHRCKISVLPLSSLLDAAPALHVAARFHRELLGVPLSSPFRQYTRLTVAVDSSVASAALHPGNAILRTYHLVAVRPLNQAAFDQACKVSEVDLISLDFSQKLPFRLKLAMVKEAIKRGIYFEVTYSHFISDSPSRRQMVSAAKLLVDWTRGKNLIFSSGASNVSEVRGPRDVINLHCFLGLSNKKAEIAISSNCRSLLNKALRRKQCYKEAIRIEKVLPNQCLDKKDPWFVDWGKWDPISSGEGDLPALDDITRIFSSSEQTSENHSLNTFETVSNVVLSKRTERSQSDLVSLDENALLSHVPEKDERSTEVDEVSCQGVQETITECEILLPVSSLEQYLPESERTRLSSNNTFYEPDVPDIKDPCCSGRCGTYYAADGGPLSGDPSSICYPKEIDEVPLEDDKNVSVSAGSPMSRDVFVNGMKSGRPESFPVILNVSPNDDERSIDDIMEVDPSCSLKNVRSLSRLLSEDDTQQFQPLAMTDKLEKDPYASIYDLLFQKGTAESWMARDNSRLPSLQSTKLNRASGWTIPDQGGAPSVPVADGMQSGVILVSMEQDAEIPAASIYREQRRLKPGKLKFRQKLRDRGLPLLSRAFMRYLPFKKVMRLRGTIKKSSRNAT